MHCPSTHCLPVGQGFASSQVYVQVPPAVRQVATMSFQQRVRIRPLLKAVVQRS